MSFNIAIDGPAGAGKSTIAKKIASELGFIYVDTGAMYRAMGLFFFKNKADVNNERQISDLAEKAEVTLKYENGTQHVFLNGEDVSGLIRTQQAADMAYAPSRYMAVRSRLTSTQKRIAAENDVVMDGRDIGTAVLPHAQLKIYLTASVERRAERRYGELMMKGEKDLDIEQIASEIAARDHQDMTRKIAPLCRAEDAILVDSSDMTIDEVTAVIRKLYEERV